MMMDRLLALASQLVAQVQECHSLHGGLLTSECRRTARELEIQLRAFGRARTIEGKKEGTVK